MKDNESIVSVAPSNFKLTVFAKVCSSSIASYNSSSDFASLTDAMKLASSSEWKYFAFAATVLSVWICFPSTVLILERVPLTSLCRFMMSVARVMSPLRTVELATKSSIERKSSSKEWLGRVPELIRADHAPFLESSEPVVLYDMAWAKT